MGLVDPLPQKARQTDHVAFASCASGPGRLLRVGLLADAAKRPTIAEIASCPACGDSHPHVALLWRRTEARDAGKAPQLLVDAKGKQLR